MTFVYIHLVLFGGWIVANLLGVPVPKWDPSLVILAMVASVEAMFLSAFVLIALQLCAARGVDVRLLITEKTDHPGLLRIGRSFYPELMSAGVRIFEYSLALNHTKAAVVDDDWLLVGSANLDNRSLRVNFELSVLTRHPAAAAELAARLEEDFAAGTEITPDVFARRPGFEQAMEAALRPFAPLL